MIYTVLGAQGFIGKHLAEALRQRGYETFCPSREIDLTSYHLGIVFYCIGLTADFRKRPIDTVDAHVCRLNNLLRVGNFKRLVYLSSTRVYAGLYGLVSEETNLVVNPNDFSDLYNISKLMGESACLHSGHDVVVARLSNVVGSDFTSHNFLFDLIREACDDKLIHLRSAMESAKDYILVEDAVCAIIAIAEHPSPKLVYNVASGRNLSNIQVCEAIGEVASCRWEPSASAPLLTFPQIDISRACKELGLIPNNVLNVIENLVHQYRNTKV